MDYSNNWTNANDVYENIPALMSSLCNLYGMQISRTTIWKELNHKGKHADFNEILAFCDRWQIEKIHLNLVPEHLHNTFFPSLVLMKNYRTILLVERKGNEVIYLDSLRGWMKEDAAKIFENSMGHVILMEPSDTIAEKNYDTIVAKENAEMKTLQEEIGLEIVDDFLTPEECQALYAAGKDGFTKSQVMDAASKKSIDSEVRTSSSSYLPGNLEIAQKVQKKAAEKFNLPLAHFEHVQLTAYGPGELYDVHSDAFGHEFKDTLSSGQRIKTILIYLTADYQGGATIFPRLQVKVGAKLGRAVSWKSLDDKGNISLLAYHGGLPVLDGYKCVSNLWVRNKPWP